MSANNYAVNSPAAITNPFGQSQDHYLATQMQAQNEFLANIYKQIQSVTQATPHPNPLLLLLEDF